MRVGGPYLGTERFLNNRAFYNPPPLLYIRDDTTETDKRYAVGHIFSPTSDHQYNK